MVTLDRRWWLTEDGSKAVEEGDPEAAYLFGNPGLEVSDRRARELGILEPEAKPKAEPKAKAGRKQMESVEAVEEADQED